VPGIFISYRRGQTSAYAGRLYDRLTAEFGEPSVFMDLNAISPGADFVNRIQEAVGTADALLVVIGPDWADADGRARLSDPGDFVRREVLGAIERDTLVVPVLVQGAEMPSAETLPEPLQPLGRRHALALSDVAWGRDVDRLIATLRERIPRQAERRERVRRHRRLLLVLGVLGLGAAGALGAALLGDRESPAPAALRIAGREVPVGGYPLFAATAGGKIWVAQQSEDRLKAVDPASRAVGDSEIIGTDLSGLAAAAGRLWTGAYGRSDSDGKGSVVDVDPATGERLGRPIPTREPIAMAADGSSLWLTTEDNRAQRVDLQKREVTATRRVAGLADVAIVGGVAWVTSRDDNRLQGYDARTAEPKGRPIPVGSHPVSVAASAGYLWVGTEQGQLVRVPVAGGPPASLPVGGEGFRFVRADERSVWVVDENSVVLVDPRRFKKVASLALPGGTLQGLALDRGGAWVLRSRSGSPSTVVRVVWEQAG
jgi:hypothetical protein